MKRLPPRLPEWRVGGVSPFQEIGGIFGFGLFRSSDIPPPLKFVSMYARIFVHQTTVHALRGTFTIRGWMVLNKRGSEQEFI